LYSIYNNLLLLKKAGEKKGGGLFNEMRTGDIQRGCGILEGNIRHICSPLPLSQRTARDLIANQEDEDEENGEMRA